MVKETFWPSSSVLKLSLWIAEKCTKTSLLPSSGVIKPTHEEGYLWITLELRTALLKLLS
jgi:hypothetical protein